MSVGTRDGGSIINDISQTSFRKEKNVKNMFKKKCCKKIFQKKIYRKQSMKLIDVKSIAFEMYKVAKLLFFHF